MRRLLATKRSAVTRDESSPLESRAAERLPSEDGRLVQQLRQGDSRAGYRFVQEYYPGTYRYLLYLTGRPEMAEDLTQETFLQAWRRLDTFDLSACLRPWLHRIAHREFLQALRSRRPETPLEEIAELREPQAAELAEAVELRMVLEKLPVEEREMVVLHYLEGYQYDEIARIVGAPVGRVRHRLTEARSRLQQELGEGDLTYLNEPAGLFRQWAWLPLDQMHALEARLGASTLSAGPGGAGERESRKEAAMERREFLRCAAVGAAGLMLPEAEKQVIDERLAQKVTLAVKAMALGDLCECLRAETGVQVAAGPSVADEKVTLFCRKLPLREVMRQLSRPFGYTWLRSGLPSPSGGGAGGRGFRYELVQDLKSQLMEEELRNRDRNAALLALEREIERYRPYLGLSPEEARERAKTAPPAEKELLTKMSGTLWGVLQLYSRLSPRELAALRAGHPVLFSPAPGPGEQPLPPDLERRVLKSWGEFRLRLRGSSFDLGNAEGFPEGQPPAAVPGVHAAVCLTLAFEEGGRCTLAGATGFTVRDDPGQILAMWQENLDAMGGASTFAGGDYENFYLIHDMLATGTSAALQPLKNAVLNARLSHEPDLRRSVTLKTVVSGQWSVVRGEQSPTLTTHHSPLTTDKVTSADVLEALHRATGLPIVADFYTRLFSPEAVSVSNTPLFDALNRLADAMGMRWNREAGAAGSSGAVRVSGQAAWLQFRSARFYQERLEEVPNRLLARWAASRRETARTLGTPALTLDDLCEIAGLADSQLDAAAMAEGARELWGLEEWDVARSRYLRPHLRLLATLAPEQRLETLRATGLPFPRLSLPQQQQFLSLALGAQAGRQKVSLEELARATLRVEVSLPGGLQWAAPAEPGGRPKIGPRAPIPEERKQRLLELQRRHDPNLTEAQVEARWQAERDLHVIYTLGPPESNPFRRQAGANGGGYHIP
jgi:RNA polymerase sigma-70 factor (ECF subfamily)